MRADLSHLTRPHATDGKNPQRDIATAAAQLESFFLRRVLAEVHSSQSGGALDGGFAGGVFKEMLDEAIADSMASGGGMGLGKMFARDLAPRGTAPGAAPSSAAPHPLPPAPRTVPAVTPAHAAPVTRVHDAYRAVGAAGAAAAAGPGVSFADSVTTAAATAELALPVTARGASDFGLRTDPLDGKTKDHRGLDLAAPSGSRVGAAAAGVVVHAGSAGTYGNLVIVDHGNGLETRYAHLEQATVKAGDMVEQGQAVGLVGQTGRATGPHLHFEVRRQGQAVDPKNEFSYLKVSR